MSSVVLSLTIILAAFKLCVGQEFIRLTGKIKEQKTGEPIPYATISLRHAPLGTVSDEAGNFEFNIPIQHATDTLVVSHIGYTSFRKEVNHLSIPQVIELKESVTVLNPVTISPSDSKDLLKKLVVSIPDIYSDTPYLMEGFHRSWEKVDFTDSISYPGTLIEAAITIYDPGYGEKRQRKDNEEEIYIHEIRRSSINEGWNYSSSALNNLLKRNVIRHNKEPGWNFMKSFLDFPNELSYEWEGETVIDDETVSIVRVDVPNHRKFPAYYKVYISQKDSAILQFELSGEKAVIDYSLGSWHTRSLQSNFSFRRYQGKPYLHYARLHYIIQNVDPANKKILRTEEYHRELLINHIITENVADKRKTLLTKKSKNTSLALENGVYNEAFWKNYNIILQNPLDKEIAEYFNKKESGTNKKRARENPFQKSR